jgi:hypothetical protein
MFATDCRYSVVVGLAEMILVHFRSVVLSRNATDCQDLSTISSVAPYLANVLQYCGNELQISDMKYRKSQSNVTKLHRVKLSPQVSQPVSDLPDLL